MKTLITNTFYLLLASMAICLFSCNNPKPLKSAQRRPIIIDLQPFQDITAQAQNDIVNQLRTVYPHVRLLGAIQLPKLAFYAARNRYRADSLINYLSRQTQAGHITIGLTSKDISTTKNGFADWGVMGLGKCPGKACVASSYRLSNNERLSQLFKVSIHELGHTQGLPHCEVKVCFMRDAEGRNPTNEEKDFCPRCKTFLKAKGWNFN